MRLFTRNQIVKRVDGLTVRQITDLSEKGIINPRQDTTGQGQTRLYDKKNIIAIMVAVSIRKALPPVGIAHLLFHLKLGGNKYWKGRKKDLFNYKDVGAVKLKHDPHNNKWHYEFRAGVSNEVSLGVSRDYHEVNKNTPAHFTAITIDVRGIVNFIEKTF